MVSTSRWTDRNKRHSGYRCHFADSVFRRPRMGSEGSMAEGQSRERQLERMREAVERKDEESKAHAEERSLDSTERPQEAIDPREKSSGHKKKTADKWNQ